MLEWGGNTPWNIDLTPVRVVPGIVEILKARLWSTFRARVRRRAWRRAAGRSSTLRTRLTRPGRRSWRSISDARHGEPARGVVPCICGGLRGELGAAVPRGMRAQRYPFQEQ